jgi:hypothetical protein
MLVIIVLGLLSIWLHGGGFLSKLLGAVLGGAALLLLLFKLSLGL